MGGSAMNIHRRSTSRPAPPAFYLLLATVRAEVLGINGVTGGFDFQSLWTTGWLGTHLPNVLNGIVIDLIM
jgi:hypothetical protein